MIDAIARHVPTEPPLPRSALIACPYCGGAFEVGPGETCEWCGFLIERDLTEKDAARVLALQPLATMRRMCALLEEIVGNTERRRRE